MAKAAKKAAKKGDGGKRAAKDKAAKTARAEKGTKAVGKGKAAAPAKDASGFKVINAAKLNTLIKDVRAANSRAAEHSGIAGNLISEAVKKEGVHARALKLCMQIEDMAARDPAKARSLLDHFDYYRDVRKLDDKAGDSLFSAEGGEERQDDDDAGNETAQEPSGDSVVTFPGSGNGAESRLAG